VAHCAGRQQVVGLGGGLHGQLLDEGRLLLVDGAARRQIQSHLDGGLHLVALAGPIRGHRRHLQLVLALDVQLEHGVHRRAEGARLELAGGGRRGARQGQRRLSRAPADGDDGARKSRPAQHQKCPSIDGLLLLLLLLFWLVARARLLLSAGSGLGENVGAQNEWALDVWGVAGEHPEGWLDGARGGERQFDALLGARHVGQPVLQRQVADPQRRPSHNWHWISAHLGERNVTGDEHLIA